MALPNSRRTSSGNSRIAALAEGWKMATFTNQMSHIRDMQSTHKLAIEGALLSLALCHNYEGTAMSYVFGGQLDVFVW
jgi:hypothetical protein